VQHAGAKETKKQFLDQFLTDGYPYASKWLAKNIFFTYEFFAYGETADFFISYGFAWSTTSGSASSLRLIVE